MTFTDSAGATFAAPLYYVSPGVINYVVPKGVANGKATFFVTAGAASFTGTALISSVAPALYTANQTGQGPAAAQALTAQGAYTNTFQCTSPGNCTVVPIDIAVSPYLVLYGTGIRGAPQTNVNVQIGNVNAPVIYSGPEGVYPGLDQVNVSLPASLAGRGGLVVTVTVNGQATNMGRVAFL